MALDCTPDARRNGDSFFFDRVRRSANTMQGVRDSRPFVSGRKVIEEIGEPFDVSLLDMVLRAHNPLAFLRGIHHRAGLSKCQVHFFQLHCFSFC